MLNNISFLALFVFLTPCFASTPTKKHSAFYVWYAPLLYMRNVD